MVYTKSELKDIEKADTVVELPDKITSHEKWDKLGDVRIPDPLKDNVERNELMHRSFDESEFWRKIPFSKISIKRFFWTQRFKTKTRRPKLLTSTSCLRNSYLKISLLIFTRG
jgi:hypothetical protein